MEKLNLFQMLNILNKFPSRYGTFITLTILLGYAIPSCHNSPYSFEELQGEHTSANIKHEIGESSVGPEAGYHSRSFALFDSPGSLVRFPASHREMVDYMSGPCSPSSPDSSSDGKNVCRICGKGYAR